MNRKRRKADIINGVISFPEKENVIQDSPTVIRDASYQTVMPVITVPENTEPDAAAGCMHDEKKESLCRFLQNGSIPSHNNRAENAVRSFVIGRKNGLFSQTPGAGYSKRALRHIKTRQEGLSR